MRSLGRADAQLHSLVANRRWAAANQLANAIVASGSQQSKFCFGPLAIHGR
jgi:hypothetical protein